MRVLMTGFAPFGGQPINPSWEAVCKTDQSLFPGTELVRVQLPVSFSGVMPAFRRAMECRPDAVLLTGQAGGRAEVCAEARAVNRMRALRPDEDGFAPRDLRILPGGGEERLSTLDIPGILAAWERAGIPGRESRDAGTFVCNRLLYGALSLPETSGVPCGFIHVPFLPSQAAQGQASMPLSQMVRALECCVGVLAGPGCA